MAMVQTARDLDFEMVCVEIDYLTEATISESARLGIWHLAWDLSEDPLLWRTLAEAGLGGVITRDVKCVDRTATPYWQPPTF